MDQIKKNEIELMETIKKYGEMPIDQARTAFLANCWAAYKALCMVNGDKMNHMHHMAYAEHTRHSEIHLPVFNRQMAEDWVSGMENADGTKGPHWTMEQTSKVMNDHKADCDPVLWWAIMNSLYSDYCVALKQNNASTVETYVCLAKAWIHDEDAVPDKAAAYYTNVVKH